jgi:hypothetical protein
MRSRSLLGELGIAALVLVLAGAAASCGDDESGAAGDASGSEQSSERPFRDATRELTRIVEDTQRAVLSGMNGKEATGPPVPCRAAGGGGPASGEFLPDYGLRYELDGRDARELAERVAGYWREQGYDQVRTTGLDAPNPSVYAKSGERNLAFDADRTTGTAQLGASGPCVKPGPDENIGT